MKIAAITIAATTGPWIGNIIAEPMYDIILLPLGRACVYSAIWLLF